MYLELICPTTFMHGSSVCFTIVISQYLEEMGMNKIISGTYKNFELAGGSGHIWIYNGLKEVQINRETLEKYEVIDTIETTTAHTTSTNKGTSRKGTKSLAGRAIVGGVLFGPVGAVVGAATAKNKNKGTTQGTTVETTTREFKVSVTFKDGSQVLLHLDEVGYDNFLVAVFSDPYIEYSAYSKELEEQKRLEDERNIKQMKGCLKFFVLPIIWLILVYNYPIVTIVSTIGLIVLKIVMKRRKNKK